MSLLVVGSGFLGGALARHRPDALHTSRQPEGRDDGRCWLRFDLDDRSTWAAVAAVRAEVVVVAAPLSSRHDPGALWAVLAEVSERIVVVGTTSAFGDRAEVTDATPIDPANPRAMVEEHLRRKGAMVLHAAGIYGPGRNPLDWIRRGRIANAGKLVNLVHVDDLARACLFLGDRFEAGARLVCSDGTPRAWREIVAVAVTRGWIADPGLLDTHDSRSKKVFPVELVRRGFTFEHPDLIAELELFETRP